MIKCVVIADDLTGANATGVLLREKGYLTSKKQKRKYMKNIERQLIESISFSLKSLEFPDSLMLI